MRTITLSLLHNKFNVKTLLLSFLTAVFLSACGIKGDLYETPEQPEKAESVQQLENENQQDNNDSENTVNAPLEANSQQKTEPVKEQQ